MDCPPGAASGRRLAKSKNSGSEGVVDDPVQFGEVAAADPVAREHLEHGARVALVLAELDEVLGRHGVGVRLELEGDPAEVVPARANVEVAQRVGRVGRSEGRSVRHVGGLDALGPLFALLPLHRVPPAGSKGRMLGMSLYLPSSAVGLPDIVR